MMSFDPEDTAARFRIRTRLGELDVDSREIIRFPDGLPGFEQCRRFVVVSSVALAPLQCLQAIDDPQPSFLVIDPRLVLPRYRCELPDAERARLSAAGDALLLWLSIASLDDERNAWVNLRAPIVINPSGMLGFQVVSHHAVYPLRHPLAGPRARAS